MNKKALYACLLSSLLATGGMLRAQTDNSPAANVPFVQILATDPTALEGTSTAAFTLIRNGDTSVDLPVYLHISGTASNGVDYVSLPGSVSVLAGQRKALITIIPIDPVPPPALKTVVLTLNTNAVTPTNNYVLGFPRSAAAVILDIFGPPPIAAMAPGGFFQLSQCGPDGSWFHIECSTNLADWSPICTNQVVNGLINFVDPDAPSNPQRFYRAVPEAGPPAY